MKLTEKYSVSETEAKRLQDMKAAALKKHIKSLNLFGGFSTEYAKEKEKEVYAKINAWRAIEKTEEIKSTGTTGTDAEDNTSGPEDSQ